MTPLCLVLRCTLAALCVLSPAFASSTARVQPKPVHHWLHFVGGTYLGNVVDGGRIVKQTVRLSRDKHGQLVGTYTVQHEETFYEGQLTDARIEGPRSVHFKWKDHHGEGVIRLDFAPDGELFEGCWGVEQLDPAQITAGRRRGTG